MSFGRPSKLTDQVRDSVCEAVAMGMTFDLAAQYAGIGRSTFFRWMRQGEQSEPGDRFRDFWDAVKRAESEGALNALATIHRAASDGSWQAAAWLLERRHAYRRDAPAQADSELPGEQELVDPTTAEGREAIVAHVAELPEDLIIAALNRRSVSE